MEIKITNISALICLVILTGCNRQEDLIKTYDDCVLKHMKEIKNTASSLKQIRSSCKEKYPITFDFDGLSNDANVKTWKEVASSDEYSKADDETKEKIKSQYFQDVIQPRVHNAYENEARTQFDSHTRKK